MHPLIGRVKIVAALPCSFSLPPKLRELVSSMDRRNDCQPFANVWFRTPGQCIQFDSTNREGFGRFRPCVRCSDLQTGEIASVISPVFCLSPRCRLHLPRRQTSHSNLPRRRATSRSALRWQQRQHVVFDHLHRRSNRRPNLRLGRQQKQNQRGHHRHDERLRVQCRHGRLRR